MADAPPPAKKARKKERQQEKKKEKQQQKSVMGQSALRALENASFVDYYKGQSILAEEEWPAFEASMRLPLPVTWRFSGYDDGAQACRARMESVLMAAMSERPHPLPWYPSRLGWQFDVSRAQLRGKDWEGADAPAGAGRSSAVKEFHAWLLRETDVGHVQRQEAVSMVPPLLLDVRPGHTVLDSCASPGSKTQQILEMLATPAWATPATHEPASHAADAPNAAASTAAAAPKGGHGSTGIGLLIANDADIKRCACACACVYTPTSSGAHVHVHVYTCGHQAVLSAHASHPYTSPSPTHTSPSPSPSTLALTLHALTLIIRLSPLHFTLTLTSHLSPLTSHLSPLTLTLTLTLTHTLTLTLTLTPDATYSLLARRASTPQASL